MLLAVVVYSRTQETGQAPNRERAKLCSVNGSGCPFAPQYFPVSQIRFSSHSSFFNEAWAEAGTEADAP